MVLMGGMLRTKTAHVFQQCIAIGGISLCVYVVSDSVKKQLPMAIDMLVIKYCIICDMVHLWFIK